MIVSDGRESSLFISNFANLEEVLTKLMEDEDLQQRIVTNVLVDDEAFSELYPHQAEDIDSESFSKLELRMVPLDEMAGDVVEELPKVITIMDAGSRRVAELFRQFDLAEGLEVIQNIIAVSRDLLNTIHVLRNQYSTDLAAILTPWASASANRWKKSATPWGMRTGCCWPTSWNTSSFPPARAGGWSSTVLPAISAPRGRHSHASLRRAS